jgi:hypothetical protein
MELLGKNVISQLCGKINLFTKISIISPAAHRGGEIPVIFMLICRVASP